MRGVQGRSHSRRLSVVLGFWLLVLLVLVARAVDLHVLQQEFLAEQGKERNLRVEPLAAHRGVIRDRQGQPLAVSTPVTTLWADPATVLEAPEQWTRLRDNPVLDRDELARAVRGRKDREFLYLERHLPPDKADQVLKQDVPGIHALTEYRRYYPAGEVASHVVGMTNIDEQGQEGVELAFNDTLKGDPGRKKVVRDLHGRVIRDLEVIEPADPGSALDLSIDLRIQYLAHRELLAAVKKHKAASGSAVVLDAATGEVLAMANHPSYNPNKRAGQKPAARRNRAATDLFEPGSTIKPLTVAAALQNDLVSPDTIIDTSPGYIRVDGKTIRDHRDYGRLKVSDVLTKSSNVGATRLALRMGEHQLPRFFSRFGLGEKTQLRFPGESQGVLPWRTQWRDIEQATLSYGYGLSMTVLQLARAYAVLANEGKRVPLTLRKRTTRPEGEQVLDPGVARQVLTMLRSVVSREGTARRAQVAGYEVAGKTGTVHKVTSNGYADDRYIAVFAGMAPAADPRYVTAVVVDDPRGEDYYGGLVAAPAFSRIMAGVLRTREVAPREPAGTWAGGDDQGGRT